jgi:hypothetical protein
MLELEYHKYIDMFDAQFKTGQIITNGFEILSDKRILFAALARDVANNLPTFQKQYYTISSLCKDTRLIIYENDSVDTTKDMLAIWSEDDNKIDVISENLGMPKLGGGTDENRCRSMAQYRNKYLEQAMSYDKGYFDYLCVMDTDLTYISIEGIAHSFGLNINWDVMTSNGSSRYSKPLYYDIWSLISTDGLIMNHIAHPPISIYKEPIRVYGAFGGLALYKMSALIQSKAKYSLRTIQGKPCDGHPDIRPMCENASICMDMVDAGFDQIYINPKQVVLRM